MPPKPTTQPPDFYDGYPEPVRRSLLRLRNLVLETARRTDGVGAIVETLKWNQPSFVTERPRSGSTIRIDAHPRGGGAVAMYFICTTHLVDRFRDLYPDVFSFEGNRALVFAPGKPIPEAPLRHCIAMALTYHLKR